MNSPKRTVRKPKNQPEKRLWEIILEEVKNSPARPAADLRLGNNSIRRIIE
jgi:hypothetical protein